MVPLGSAEVCPVHKTIDSGNMSTLNCPEEVFLAEKLIEINPWADMVRFARSGGEANAIAIAQDPDCQLGNKMQRATICQVMKVSTSR